MNAEIVAIGSELLLGQIVDTNSAWMAQRLAELGVNMFYVTVVGDNFGRMKHVLTEALERSDVVITSGGIGPTKDDLTREAIAEVTGRELVLDEGLLQQLRERFQRRGRLLTPNNERQAYIPAGAIPVENPQGTAPAFVVEDPRGVTISLPGVPFELKWLFENEVVPYLRRKFDIAEVIVSRVLKVAELGESRVDHSIGDLMTSATNPTIGVLAHPGQVDVRITAKASDAQTARDMIAPVEEQVRGLLGEHVFAADDQTMESVVGELLQKKSLSIAVYEDLTGGMLAERLRQANADGFKEGIIGGTGSVQRVLSQIRGDGGADGSPQDDVVLTERLASAVRAWSGADLGLASHGVTDDKAERENLSSGRTYVSLAGEQGVVNRMYEFAGTGRPDRLRASFNALEFLRQALLD
jgi:nicotinamide-nucleotide amidase